MSLMNQLKYRTVSKKSQWSESEAKNTVAQQSVLRFPVIESLLMEGCVDDVVKAILELQKNLENCIDWHEDVQISASSETAKLGLNETIMLLETLRELNCGEKTGRI